MTHRTALPFFALLLLPLLACGDDSSPPDMDAGMGTDASMGTDAGMGTDTGPGDDDAGPMGTDAGPDTGPGEMCPDTVDDDTYMTATDLGDISDRDEFPAGTEMGDIFPLSDQDWYQWHVEDNFGGDVDPRGTINARPAGVAWELCVYFDCDSDLESVGCESATGTPNTHVLVDGEIEGCCLVSTEGAGEVTLAPRCSGIDDSGQVYVRVSRQGGPTATCDGYELNWGDA